jgi:hypothetical protein
MSSDFSALTSILIDAADDIGGTASQSHCL